MALRSSSRRQLARRKGTTTPRLPCCPRQQGRRARVGQRRKANPRRRGQVPSPGASLSQGRRFESFGRAFSGSGSSRGAFSRLDLLPVNAPRERLRVALGVDSVCSLVGEVRRECPRRCRTGRVKGPQHAMRDGERAAAARRAGHCPLECERVVLSDHVCNRNGQRDHRLGDGVGCTRSLTWSSRLVTVFGDPATSKHRPSPGP